MPCFCRLVISLCSLSLCWISVLRRARRAPHVAPTTPLRFGPTRSHCLDRIGAPNARCSARVASGRATKRHDTYSLSHQEEPPSATVLGNVNPHCHCVNKERSQVELRWMTTPAFCLSSGQGPDRIPPPHPITSRHYFGEGSDISRWCKTLRPWPNLSHLSRRGCPGHWPRTPPIRDHLWGW